MQIILFKSLCLHELFDNEQIPGSERSILTIVQFYYFGQGIKSQIYIVTDESKAVWVASREGDVQNIKGLKTNCVLVKHAVSVV